jgi:hypothetical protein
MNPACSSTNDHDPDADTGCNIDNPQDLAGNGILISEVWYGDDFTNYAGLYCTYNLGCEDFNPASVVVLDDAVKACRCDSHWGCNGESCVTDVSVDPSWERVGSVTCTGCPSGTCD